MPDVLLYPRLSPRAARTLLVQLSQLTMPELQAVAGASHEDEVFPATGGTRATAPQLQALRERVVELAMSAGFPAEVGQDAAARFDVAVGAQLAALPMTPGEAARDDVWAFLTLVLLPDVACWRFPDRNERRLLGGVRNAFQRMWWRAFVLRDAEAQDPWHLLRLPEDALVGLMERPGISSNPRVALEIARTIEHLAGTVPSASREDAWRDAYKRIRQRIPIVNFDWFPPGELRALLQGIGNETRMKFATRL
jgi:hypothetical protein